jgi:hypothetical protein
MRAASGAEAGDWLNVLSGSMRSASAQGPEHVLAGGILGSAADGVWRKVVDRAPLEGRPDPGPHRTAAPPSGAGSSKRVNGMTEPGFICYQK